MAILIKLLLLSLLAFIGSCSNSIEFGEVKYQKDDSLLAKGNYLFNVSACNSCHGNTNYKSIGNESLIPPSLNNANSNLGSWTVTNIVHFFKSGETPKGFKIISGVHEGYEWLSDRDLMALASFLKTLPSSNGNIKFRKKDFSHFSFKTLYSREVRSYVPEIAKTNTIAYGKYISNHVARCSECHSGTSSIFSSETFLGGGKEIYLKDRKHVVPALNGEGREFFLNWQNNEIYRFLKTGRLPGGKVVNDTLCPVEYFSKLDKKDSEALLKYFNSF